MRERLCGGRLASAARAERPRHGQPGRLPLSRSEAHPVPSLPFETPVACSAWFGRIGCCIGGRGGFAACLIIWRFFFLLFVGTIRAVWDRRSCSFRSPRSPVIRWFCGGKLTSVSVCGEQNFWASRKERGLVCLRV